MSCSSRGPALHNNAALPPLLGRLQRGGKHQGQQQPETLHDGAEAEAEAGAAAVAAGAAAGQEVCSRAAAAQL